MPRPGVSEMFTFRRGIDRLRTERFGQRGFSSLELVIVVFLILVVTTLAAPSLRATMTAYRGSAAIQGIASQLSLSRMRAASDFTRTRLSLDTSQNTYHRERFDKAAASYRTEGGEQSLGKGVSFGYGSITVPAGGQSSIQQS